MAETTTGALNAADTARDPTPQPEQTQEQKDAELGRNIRASTGGDPVTQAAAARIVAGDAGARLPRDLTLDQIDGQDACIVVFDPHLKRFNCAVGDQVISFTQAYAGLAGIRLDPKTGFTVAPADKVREAANADPLITK